MEIFEVLSSVKSKDKVWPEYGGSVGGGGGQEEDLQDSEEFAFLQDTQTAFYKQFEDGFSKSQNFRQSGIGSAFSTGGGREGPTSPERELEELVKVLLIIWFIFVFSCVCCHCCSSVLNDPDCKASSSPSPTARATARKKKKKGLWRKKKKVKDGPSSATPEEDEEEDSEEETGWQRCRRTTSVTLYQPGSSPGSPVQDSSIIHDGSDSGYSSFYRVHLVKPNKERGSSFQVMRNIILCQNVGNNNAPGTSNPTTTMSPGGPGNSCLSSSSSSSSSPPPPYQEQTVAAVEHTYLFPLCDSSIPSSSSSSGGIPSFVREDEIRRTPGHGKAKGSTFNGRPQWYPLNIPEMKGDTDIACV